MEDNKFIKNIQDNLDGLKFQPAEKVWPEVQYRLHKDKRKRRVFFFWLLACLLIAGGIAGYQFFSSRKSLENITTDPTPQKNNGTYTTKNTTNLKNAEPDKKTLDSLKIVAENLLQNPSLKAALNIKATAGIASEDDNIISKESELIVAKPKVKYPAKTKTRVTISRNTDDNIENKPGVEGQMAVPDRSIENTEPAPVANQLPEIKAVITDSVVKKELVTSNKEEPVKQATENVSVQAVPQTPKEKKKTSPWIFSAGLYVGSSGLGEKFGQGILGVAKSLDANAISGGILPPNPSSPSLPSFRKSISWGLSFDAEKKLNNTFSFKTGAGYTLLSAKFNTGGGSPNAFTSSRISGAYNNKFHFVDVHAGLGLNLLTRKKWSAGLHLGGAAGYLFSINALVYDSATKLFYRDNASFNRLQVGFNSSLLLKYSFSEKLALSGGLQMMNNLTPAGNNLIYSNSYFNSWGLKLNYYFNKKR